MLYEIFLDNGFSGEHMGLAFADGSAHTRDEFLATRLQSKGYRVTAEKVAADEAASDTGEAAEAPPFIDGEVLEADASEPRDFEKMTVADLKSFAEEMGIDLGGAKVKADIIAAIAAEAVQ